MICDCRAHGKHSNRIPNKAFASTTRKKLTKQRYLHIQQRFISYRTNDSNNISKNLTETSRLWHLGCLYRLLVLIPGKLYQRPYLQFMAFFDGWSKMGHDVFFRTNQLHDCEVTFETHCLAKEKIWKSILGAKYDQQTNFYFIGSKLLIAMDKILRWQLSPGCLISKACFPCRWNIRRKFNQLVGRRLLWNDTAYICKNRS